METSLKICIFILINHFFEEIFFLALCWRESFHKGKQRLIYPKLHSFRLKKGQNNGLFRETRKHKQPPDTMKK